MINQVDLLTREDAARELNVSPWTVLRWQKAGWIRAAVNREKRGGVVRYERAEVERVKNSHQKRHRWQVA